MNREKQLKLKKKESWVRYVIAEIQLPMELNDYIDVFSEESAGKLLLNYLGDHVIKTNDKDFLYRPLYSLFIKKLEVFYQYLDEILEKKWIKLFTNLAGAPILFILKKDGNI